MFDGLFAEFPPPQRSGELAMATLEDSDDDFFVPAEEAVPSASKSLKRLRKGVSKNLQTRQAFSAEQSSKQSISLGKDGCGDVHIAANHSLGTEFDDAENVYGEEFSRASEMESNMEEKAVDPDDGEEKRDEDTENNEESEEEDVDEDDEAAVLNLLSKETQVLKESPQKPLNDIGKEGSPEATGKAANRKGRMAELEEMHAQSQRLLREATHVSFKARPATGKSISSVLEKIRMRKAQLMQGLEKKPLPRFKEPMMDVVPGENDAEPSSNKNDGIVMDVPVEVAAQQDQDNQLHEAEQLLGGSRKTYKERQETVQQEIQDFAIEEKNLSRSSGKLITGANESIGDKFLEGGTTFRAPMEDTQDLFCHSQSSHEEDFDEINIKCPEAGVMGCVSQVNLHLDTETQDDIGWLPGEDCNVEQTDQTFKSRSKPANLAVAPVRALIDDEAEDEDEDEVLLTLDDEEYPDDGEFHNDLVTDDNTEEASDMQKRAELHRKWLEQQDAARTDDILERLKTGWVPKENRKRGLDFLEEDDDDIFLKDIDELKHNDDARVEERVHGLPDLPDDNGQDAEDLKEQNCQDEIEMTRACMETQESLESSDDDESGHRLLRQRFLEESEEQEEFTLAAEDESSREVFGLINKVNVATHKKIKSGVAEIRSLNGFSNSNLSCKSKSSFLRRTASSSLQSGQRQNSSASGARSFIFGRDDSNSSHGLSSGDHQADAEVKENLEPSQGLRRYNSDSRPGQKTGKGSENSSSASRSGPSLFEILKRQATNLDQAIQNQNSKSASKVVPVLTAFKPIKSNGTLRGI